MSPMLAVIEGMNADMPKADSTSYLVLDPGELGRQLKAARSERGLTLQQVVAQMRVRFNDAPSTVTLGRYERGDTPIPLDVFVALMLTLRSGEPMKRISRAVMREDARSEWRRINAE